MKYALKEKDSYFYVVALKPFRIGEIKHAFIFSSYSECERVLFLYGIEDDFEIVEL